MTRIDFYISPHPGTRETLTCRLAEKAYRHGHRILIHCPDEATIQHLDDLLWSYRQGSFLPHEPLRPGSEPEAPILLTTDPGEHTADVLINLADEVPQGFSRHLRILEIIDDDPHTKAAGRRRFKYYRERGYPLQTHTL